MINYSCTVLPMSVYSLIGYRQVLGYGLFFMEGFRSIAVHCGNVAEGLRTIMLPCGTLQCTAVHYALRCIAVQVAHPPAECIT